MEIIKKTKEKCPLVHSITNYVTVNDVANAILACGGSPIMADDINEVEDIENICDSLVINIGTITQRTFESMKVAIEVANKLNHIVVLDPVGCGASKFRTEITKYLIDNYHFDVIKGNISEIKALFSNSNTTKGVDASNFDLVTLDNLDENIKLAKEFSKITNSIIAITGSIDIICDKNKAYYSLNGDQKMSKITGCGCMEAGVIASYISANKDNLLLSTAYAICAFGYSAELALKYAKGTGSLHIGIIDELSNLNDLSLQGGLKIYEK